MFAENVKQLIPFEPVQTGSKEINWTWRHSPATIDLHINMMIQLISWEYGMLK